MALELNFGTIFGFTIFVFIVVAFMIGVLIYVIYDRCKNKESSKVQDLEYSENVKTEPDGASWTNPIVEMEEMLDAAENNNAKEDTVSEETTEPQPEVDNHQNYGFQEEAYNYGKDQSLPLPVPEEVEQIPDDMQIDEESEEEAEEVPEVRPSTPVEVVQYSQMAEFNETPGYARVDEVSRSDSKTKPKVGKLSSQINAFEERSRESTLVRGSKKNELEGIKINVVSGLVSEYETSDSILAGRQMSDDPAMLLGQNIGKRSESQAPQRNVSFSSHGMDNSNNRVSQIAETSGAVNRHSHLDADTGEPLYSQPDLSRKTSRRSQRDSNNPAVEEDAASLDDADGSLSSPGLPPKAPDI